MQLFSLCALLAACVVQVQAVPAWRARQLRNFMTGRKDNGVPRYNDTFIKYDACKVKVIGDDGRRQTDGSYMYLQQIFKSMPARVRLYKVVADEALTIKVFRYVDQSLLFDAATGEGLCDKSPRDRKVDLSNVAETSCDIPMKVAGRKRYTGSNVETGGCPTTFGPFPGYVTSEVEISRRSMTALDIGYVVRDGAPVRLFGEPQVFTPRAFKPSVAVQQLKLAHFLSGEKDNEVAPEDEGYVKYDACVVKAIEADGSVSTAAKHVYLQEIFNNGFPARVRLYKVVPDGDDVTLEISKYVDQSLVFDAETGEGVCHRNHADRKIQLSNVAAESCPIIMEWFARNSFIGSNAQLGGCTSSFGPVKTDVLITDEFVQAQSKGFKLVGEELIQIFGFEPLVLTDRN